MPIYTIELDGKQYDIEGDRPPSEQEARQAIGDMGQVSQPQQQVQEQQSMEPQNILGQLFNVPGAAIRSAIQGKGYTQGAIQPSSIPKFQDLAIEATQKSTDPMVNVATGMIPSALGMAADMATDPTTLLSSLIGIGGSGTKLAQNIGKAEITLKNENLAGRMVNSLIRPVHKDFSFGKNPGLGVAKEGIVANSLDDLAGKVDIRIEDIKQAIGTIRSTPENVYKSVDLSKIKEPLINSLKSLKNSPRTNAAEITGIEDAMADVTDLLQKVDKIGLNKLSVSEAYQIKDVVSKMQKWDRQGTDVLNKTLKNVYHSIDESIDTAIPELANLNDRMADLISAQQAIDRRVETLMKQEPATWKNVVDLPFAIYRTPSSKTLLGKLLAKQYKLPKSIKHK